jgi:hypothetical protein
MNAASGFTTLPRAFETFGGRGIIEHLADAFGEEKASERVRHVWKVRPPLGSVELTAGDRIRDHNHAVIAGRGLG